MNETRRCAQCGAEIPEQAPGGHCPKCMLRAGIDDTGGQTMNQDRNLLFGVLAVQLRKVTPANLMDIAAAWATDPSRSLPDRLVAAGLLTEADRELLLGFVDQAIDAHGGDSSAAMESFGGDEQVHQSFRGSIVRAESGEISIAATTPMPQDGPVDPEQVPAVQETPGRYMHLSEYARGGMGRVLLVQDQHLGRDVALKELLPGPGSESDGSGASPVRLSVPYMARFLQEARITGQLEHPSIVPVYELGHRKDGTLYYTMKLVRGKTLAAALKECKGLKDRLELLPHFIDLCQAIAYAHSRGVIHRDLKPLNVMVGQFGETVVIDWGLAKAQGRSDAVAVDMEKTFHALQLGDEAGLAQTAYGKAMGTPAYMPPEQAKGLLDQIDERSDVYALGAVLYELLTGKTPFSGKTLHEIIHKVVNETPKPISELDANVPPELTAICNRAMDKEPKKRYQSAKELAEDVQRFLAGALVSAHEYRFTDRLSRWAKQHRKELTVAWIAILILLGASAWAYRNSINARRLLDSAREAAVATACRYYEFQNGIYEDINRAGQRDFETLGTHEAARVRLFVRPFDLSESANGTTLSTEICERIRYAYQRELLKNPFFKVSISEKASDIAIDAKVLTQASDALINFSLSPLDKSERPAQQFSESVRDHFLPADLDLGTSSYRIDLLAKAITLKTSSCFKIRTAGVQQMLDNQVLLDSGSRDDIFSGDKFTLFRNRGTVDGIAKDLSSLDTWLQRAGALSIVSTEEEESLCNVSRETQIDTNNFAIYGACTIALSTIQGYSRQDKLFVQHGEMTVKTDDNKPKGDIAKPDLKEVSVDVTAPNIGIFSPREPCITFGGTVQIEGMAVDKRGVASVSIDEREVASSNGASQLAFSVEVPLGRGRNTFVVSAKDLAGNEGRTGVKIYHLDPSTLPRVPLVVTPGAEPQAQAGAKFNERLELRFREVRRFLTFPRLQKDFDRKVDTPDAFEERLDTIRNASEPGPECLVIQTNVISIDRSSSEIWICVIDPSTSSLCQAFSVSLSNAGKKASLDQAAASVADALYRSLPILYGGVEDCVRVLDHYDIRIGIGRRDGIRVGRNVRIYPKTTGDDPKFDGEIFTRARVQQVYETYSVATVSAPEEGPDCVVKTGWPVVAY